MSSHTGIQGDLPYKLSIQNFPQDSLFSVNIWCTGYQQV